MLGWECDVVCEFSSHGMEVVVRIDGDPYELPASIDVTALRVVQEALTNVHKHGTGRRAHVSGDLIATRTFHCGSRRWGTYGDKNMCDWSMSRVRPGYI